MSQWKYNDVVLEVDMEDYDFQAKYEEAFNKMDKTEKELQKVGSLAEITKGYCQMFYQLFDDIFGTGTGDKLFGGKYNTRIVDECFDSFIWHCKKEVDTANRRKMATVKKYKVAKKR
jgi:hypothetical protein